MAKPKLLDTKVTSSGARSQEIEQTVEVTHDGEQK